MAQGAIFGQWSYCDITRKGPAAIKSVDLFFEVVLRRNSSPFLTIIAGYYAKNKATCDNDTQLSFLGLSSYEPGGARNRKRKVRTENPGTYTKGVPPYQEASTRLLLAYTVIHE